MDLWTIALLLLALGLAIYYLFCRDLNYFDKWNIPYVRPLPIVGNLGGVLLERYSFIDTFRHAYDLEPKDAKYVGYFFGPNPALVIRDLELIKLITVKNFEHFTDHDVLVKNSQDMMHRTLFFLQGDKWKRMRMILTPAFTSSKLKAMFRLMYDCGSEFVDSSIALASNNEDIDMLKLITKYTTDMIATCAFGISVNSVKNPENEFYMSSNELLRQFRSKYLVMLRFMPTVAKMLNLKVTSDQMEAFFRDIISSTFKARDDQKINRPDMLQLLMDIRDKQKDLTMEDLVAQAFLFFAAGFNTISMTASFACHQLAVNPDIQTKLQNEIDEVLENFKGAPTYEAISGMEYLQAVIYESLRFYPVVPALDRVCVKSMELPPTVPGAKPFVVKEGMVVFIPNIAIHLDPKYYDDPETFRPERFVGKKHELYNSGTFFAFGAGPRMCIGNRFAEMELKVLLFNLLAKCNLLVGTKTQVPLKLAKNFSIEPEKGFWLKIEPRKK